MSLSLPQHVGVTPDDSIPGFVLKSKAPFYVSDSIFGDVSFDSNLDDDNDVLPAPVGVDKSAHWTGTN